MISISLSTDRRSELEKRLNSLESVEQVKTARHDTGEIVTTIKANWQELDNEQRLQFIQKFIKKWWYIANYQRWANG